MKPQQRFIEKKEKAFQIPLASKKQTKKNPVVRACVGMCVACAPWAGTAVNSTRLQLVELVPNAEEGKAVFGAFV